MNSYISRTLVTLALALVAGVGTAGFAAAPALAGDAFAPTLAGDARQICDDRGTRGPQAERARAQCERLALLKMRTRFAAATGFRMGTIGVPATPILH